MKNINTQSLYEIFRQHPVISIDSRNITPGSIFFALKGDNFDGNKFAHQAIDNGASFAIVDDPLLKQQKQMLFTPNTLAALQNLARYHRQKLQIPVIGITGSNGKTTTKELIGKILSKKLNTLITKGNLNNHIGVPLTLLSIRPDTQIAVIEMGANHQYEIANLCKIANPTHGLITNIGKAHLEGFGDLQGVIRAKSELYTYIRENNGVVFINQDDNLLENLAYEIEKIGYSQKDNALVKGQIITETPFLSLEILIMEVKFQIKSQLIGAYNINNILAAIAVGSYFNVDPRLIKSAVESYKPDNNRSQFIRTRSNQIIMDAYNANPSSMEAAILNFSKFPGSHKVMILGDMLELGSEAKNEHLKIINLAISSEVEKIIFVGMIFKDLVKAMPIESYLDVDELQQHLKTNPLTDKTILIKGSRGKKLEKLLEAL